MVAGNSISSNLTAVTPAINPGKLFPQYAKSMKQRIETLTNFQVPGPAVDSLLHANGEHFVIFKRTVTDDHCIGEFEIRLRSECGFIVVTDANILSVHVTKP